MVVVVVLGFVLSESVSLTCEQAVTAVATLVVEAAGTVGVGSGGASVGTVVGEGGVVGGGVDEWVPRMVMVGLMVMMVAVGRVVVVSVLMMLVLLVLVTAVVVTMVP